jgi:thiol-disulfide isomerase/thioredoxin
MTFWKHGFCAALVLGLLVHSAIAQVETAQVDDEVAAEEQELLTIGSAAPKLNIEHWLSDGEGKFSHITEFKEGKVYVVEFWATWCGPCIASMPHISGLQKEYADKGVQVVSVSDEDLETVEEFLEGKVRNIEEDMTYAELTNNYCLTTDPDRSVSKDYMQAAGQNGIPTAFIVGKKGEIEWIGHPMSMDEVLEQVVSDSWDRAAFAAEFKATQELERKQQRLMRLLQANKVDEALELIEGMIETAEDPTMQLQVKAIRLQIMLTSNHKKSVATLLEFAEENKENAELLNQISWLVYEIASEDAEEAHGELLKAAIKVAEMATASDPKSGSILDTLAHLHYVQGNLDKALELQEQAVKLGGPDLEPLQEFLDQLKEEKAEKDKPDTAEKNEEKTETPKAEK